MWVKPIVKSVLTLQPGLSPRALKGRLRLVQHIARQWPALRAFVQRMTAALGEPGFKRLGGDCIGVVHWPYISRSWEAPERLETVASHYEVVARRVPALLLLGRDERRVLCDLGDLCAGSSLVLDRAVWFKREGELVLNLFQGELRVASLAFTLRQLDAGLCLFVGAVQGIHKGIDSETSLNIYRELTKDFEGLRPRSLLIEALKCLARYLGVVQIFAVADEYRHHRHPYFGREKALDLGANYDVIWQENGAIASARADFYSLPVAASTRAAEDVAAKKRAMYRRRQALLDVLFARLQAALPGAASVPPSPLSDAPNARANLQGSN